MYDIHKNHVWENDYLILDLSNMLYSLCNNLQSLLAEYYLESYFSLISCASPNWIIWLYTHQLICCICTTFTPESQYICMPFRNWISQVDLITNSVVCLVLEWVINFHQSISLHGTYHDQLYQVPSWFAWYVHPHHLGT